MKSFFAFALGVVFATYFLTDKLPPSKERKETILDDHLREQLQLTEVPTSKYLH